MAETRDFGKHTKLRRLLEALRRVLRQPGGAAAVQARAQALEEAGLFQGTDWASPEILIPSLVGSSLHSGNADTVVMEATSELRMLAVARGDFAHPTLPAEDARQFLSQVLANEPGAAVHSAQRGGAHPAGPDRPAHPGPVAPPRRRDRLRQRPGQPGRRDLADPAPAADPGRCGAVPDHPDRGLPRGPGRRSGWVVGAGRRPAHHEPVRDHRGVPGGPGRRRLPLPARGDGRRRPAVRGDGVRAGDARHRPGVAVPRGTAPVPPARERLPRR